MSAIDFLRAELAPKPGRLENVLRITLFTVLVVIFVETFQTPFPAYSAYIVLFFSKEESASTLLTVIVAALAATVSTILAIGIYTISAGEPGLRLPLMALLILTSLFFSRASPLGPAAFLTGFLATLALTLIDFIPTNTGVPVAQLLTKSVLWLWGVVMIPVTMVVIGNVLFGRKPLDLFRQGLVEHLELANRLLNKEAILSKDTKRIAAFNREGMQDLQEYLKKASVFDKQLFREKWAKQLLINTRRVIILIIEWRELHVDDPYLQSVVSECAAKLSQLAKNIQEEKSGESYPKLILHPYSGNSEQERKAYLLIATLIELLELMSPLPSQNAHVIPENEATPKEKSAFHLLFPDAFTNPDYTQYALKTTLAIFIAYISYNLLNWPGIRTCMITCFFVSLGTFGETAQKFTLRMVGAIIGGALGFLAILFVMPYITTITGLCVLITVVTFFAAWVASSSERLSYAGFQIGLAFFLCVLDGYGPTIELTPPRDRVVGVLFGNLIIAVIFSTVWPRSAIEQSKLALATALEKISGLFSMGPRFRENKEKTDALSIAYNDALQQAKRLFSLHLFEDKILKRSFKVNSALIDKVRSIKAPVIILAEDPFLLSISALSSSELKEYYEQMSEWFHQLSQQIITNEVAFLPLPNIENLAQKLEHANIDPNDYLWFLAYLDWYRTLDKRLYDLDHLVLESMAPESHSENHALEFS
jgi:multidrug resistance protein MdtO